MINILCGAVIQEPTGDVAQNRQHTLQSTTAEGDAQCVFRSITKGLVAIILAARLMKPTSSALWHVRPASRLYRGMECAA
jgi:hypothetical protein